MNRRVIGRILGERPLGELLIYSYGVIGERFNMVGLHISIRIHEDFNHFCLCCYSLSRWRNLESDMQCALWPTWYHPPALTSYIPHRSLPFTTPIRTSPYEPSVIWQSPFPLICSSTSSQFLGPKRRTRSWRVVSLSLLSFSQISPGNSQVEGQYHLDRNGNGTGLYQ
jgi:hypothetical protein